ncbi:PAS domain S-box protein [Methanosarcina sp. KYL-1]|uniref:PAS domain-containing protein n=1 Tax=Methanosarcina sp. KYL-1 TaxID=2602068 RepID=UPI00210137A1|nr:PAS domain-containing protein [Methanosarcina sp. KYL-1]MCQ1534900.1 PAS domain S-box protein [Methanosarcina sp. KYL-1]
MDEEAIKISLQYPTAELFEGETRTFPENSLAKILKMERRYRLFAEKTGRMFFEADLVKGKVEWVGAIKDVTGYDVEEFHAIDLAAFKEFIHQEDRKRMNERIDISLKTGEELNEEYRFLRKDGKYVYLENIATFLIDSEGRPYKTLGVLNNITEKVLSRQKLERTREKFLHVAEQTGQLIFDIDAGTNRIEWAGAIEEITGFTPEELSEFYLPALRDLIHPGERERVWSTLESSLKTGDKFYQEFWARKKDGSYIYVENSAILLKDEKGQVYRVLGVMKNITEKKQSREKLQKSEERYRFVTEQTGQMVYDCCVENDKIDCSGPFKEITGYGTEAFKEGGVDFWIEHVHPEDREMVWETHKKLLETGGIICEEYRFRKKDGSYLYLEDHGIALKDEMGRICRILGVLKDITEKKLSEEIIKQAEEIRKKEIHHRIKNNLQVISSLLDLQAEKFSDSRVVEAFRESQSRVISMSMIHEELYRSRDMENLDFTAYVQKLAAELFRSYNLESTAINLLMDIEKDISLKMDTAIPMGIIINELVSNALKHAFPEGTEGEIRIKIHRLRSHNPENPESNGNSRLLLIISDNGSGFPENIDFENPNSLGLQLVNTLVEQIEGEIELKRKKGTEFRIAFGEK